MKRLVAFGCSITYGHALPDCHVPPGCPGLSPSKQAWPNLVATHFNVALSNQSVCGNSNLAILNDILKFKFLKGDVAIIMWSFTDRDLLFGKKNFLGKQELIPIGRWQNSELSEHWIATHPETDLATRSWFYMHHATLYLKSIRIPLYNLFTGYKEWKGYKPKYLKLDFYKTKTQGMSPIDRGLDNLHPGPLTHGLIAEEIIKILYEN